MNQPQLDQQQSQEDEEFDDKESSTDELIRVWSEISTNLRHYNELYWITTRFLTGLVIMLVAGAGAVLTIGLGNETKSLIAAAALFLASAMCVLAFRSVKSHGNYVGFFSEMQRITELAMLERLPIKDCAEDGRGRWTVIRRLKDLRRGPAARWSVRFCMQAFFLIFCGLALGAGIVVCVNPQALEVREKPNKGTGNDERKPQEKAK